MEAKLAGKVKDAGSGFVPRLRNRHCRQQRARSRVFDEVHFVEQVSKVNGEQGIVGVNPSERR